MATMDNSTRTASTISPLQLMQARIQKKLLQDKQEIMMQLYPGNNNNGSSNGGTSKTRGGAVRQFFAQRRANNNNDDDNNLLNNSGGLISLQQSFNSSWSSNNLRNGPKQGSPVGWDKSYPLSPLDRDSSGGSSSGYDSGNASGSPYLNNFAQTNGRKPQQRSKAAINTTTTRKPSRRTPSLDRYGTNPHSQSNNRSQQSNIRRSNSQQILTSTSKENDFMNYNNNNSNNNKAQRQSQKKKPSTLSVANVSPPPAQPVVPAPVKGVPAPQQLPKSKKAVIPAIKPKVNYTQPQKQIGKRAGQSSASSADPNLVECDICGRRFAPDRIDKHLTICQKTSKKKRKVFDPTKMRTQGTELEEYARGSSAKSEPEPQMPKKDWRAKRNNFIETLRQAKAAQRHVAAGGKLSDLPPPPPLDTSDYVQCPHCERKFSEGAADRHIPKCANIKSNKRPERK